MENNYVLIQMEDLMSLKEEVKALREDLKAVASRSTKQVYTNAEIKELLGIKDKLLKEYRDDGLLSYSKVKDKFWYSQSDINKFLASSHVEAFSV